MNHNVRQSIIFLLVKNTLNSHLIHSIFHTLKSTGNCDILITMKAAFEYYEKGEL